MCGYQIPTITPLVICLGLLGHVPSVGCQGSVTWCSEPKGCCNAAAGTCATWTEVSLLTRRKTRVCLKNPMVNHRFPDSYIISRHTPIVQLCWIQGGEHPSNLWGRARQVTRNREVVMRDIHKVLLFAPERQSGRTPQKSSVSNAQGAYVKPGVKMQNPGAYGTTDFGDSWTSTPYYVWSPDFDVYPHKQQAFGCVWVYPKVDWLVIDFKKLCPSVGCSWKIWAKRIQPTWKGQWSLSQLLRASSFHPAAISQLAIAA